VRKVFKEIMAAKLKSDVRNIDVESDVESKCW
jgi:hypothetical protein